MLSGSRGRGFGEHERYQPLLKAQARPEEWATEQQ